MCVLWVAPPYRLPRAVVQLNAGLDLPVCPELVRFVPLKLNRVLKILCALIIAFLALFLFWGARALDIWIMWSLRSGRGCVFLPSLLGVGYLLVNDPTPCMDHHSKFKDLLHC